MNQRPLISVIIGAKNARQTIGLCLRALIAQASDIATELIVVDGSTDGTAQLVAAEFPQVRLLRRGKHYLVPQLWGMGFDCAQGEIIAFTNAQCIPADDWLATIMAAHSDERADSLGIAGVGGPIEGPVGGNSRDWATYFARYNGYLPPGRQEFVNDVAGDNAAYKYAALESCHEEMQSGFWETLVHLRLRAEGQRLMMMPEMRVQLGRGSSLLAIATMRLQHGRHYGSTRPSNSPFMRLIRVLTAPLIAPVLLLRIINRVLKQRPDWTPQLMQALPALLLLLTAWTIGEVSGYIVPQRSLHKE